MEPESEDHEPDELGGATLVFIAAGMPSLSLFGLTGWLEGSFRALLLLSSLSSQLSTLIEAL